MPDFKREAENMAKDGTMRGGARPGSGKKKKPLVEKILDGNAATVVEFGAPDLLGADMPPPREYLSAKQQTGSLIAADIYKTTWAWLHERGCSAHVPAQIIEQYAMAISRWIQCEESISKYGFLAKHPTTGNAIQSPYVAMSQTFSKQAIHLWFQIYQIVKENCTSSFGGATPHDDMMERLLTARRGK
jgi:hypothetical protein